MKATIKPQSWGRHIDLKSAIPLNTPLVIYTEPSGFCNLRCDFCPHKMSGNLTKHLMSTSTWIRQIDGCGDFENKIKLLRVCGLGEPLLNKEIMNFLHYAQNSKHFERIELVTNGTLLDDFYARALTEYADNIIISLNGLSDKDYMRVTNSKVNFDGMVKNLSTLYRHRNRCVVHIKITSEVANSEDKERKFFRMFGNMCDEISVEKLVPMWPGLHSTMNTPERRWDDGGALKQVRVCPQFFKGMQVAATGQVLACCVDWSYTNILGDLNYRSLYQIWNGKKMKALRAMHLAGCKEMLALCKDCRMNDGCEYDDIEGLLDES